MKAKAHVLFWLLMAVLVPLELLCARMAYETIGEIASGGLVFMVVVVNVCVVLLSIWSRVAAAIAAVAVGLLVIPYQLYLGNRLLCVKAEADAIVCWAHDQRLKTGQFPADLNGYAWHNASVKKYIQDYSVDVLRGGFHLSFYVGTESTSHWYSPGGGWGYYQD